MEASRDACPEPDLSVCGAFARRSLEDEYEEKVASLRRMA